MKTLIKYYRDCPVPPGDENHPLNMCTFGALQSKTNLDIEKLDFALKYLSHEGFIEIVETDPIEEEKGETFICILQKGYAYITMLTDTSWQFWKTTLNRLWVTILISVITTILTSWIISLIHR